MKSGFAVLVGRSNVGKSTLLNSLVGSKVAITTPKAQTTRHAIHGIVNDEEGQIVFVDTPGVLQKKDTLTKALLNIVRDSLRGIDVVVYVVDATRSIGNEEKMIMRMVKASKSKKVLCINKIDSRPRHLEAYRDLAESFDEVVEVSALRGTHLAELKAKILEHLPVGEAYYPEGQLTNQPNDILVAELIREKLFLRLQQEVPYGIHVVVDEIKQKKDTLHIKARIVTNEDRYKGIIIGKGGRGLKEVGQAARKDLETIINGKVHLRLQVEVNPRWVEQML